MKRIAKNIISKSALVFVIISFVACSKFLEEPVDNRTGISSIPDMLKALEYLHPRADQQFTDFMTDDYVNVNAAGHAVVDVREKIRTLFEFRVLRQSLVSTEMMASTANPNLSYRRYFYRIINALLIIEKAKAYPISTAQEQVSINEIIGKALALKAYSHYELVNLFGKPYNEVTAANDLAMPYIDTYSGEAVVSRPRASVKAIYDGVEKDYLQAIELLRDEETAAVKPPFTFSKVAVTALISRLYLDKKDWDNCIKYADMALAKRYTPLPIANLLAEAGDNSDKYSQDYLDPANPAYLLVSNNTYQMMAYFWSGFYFYPIANLFIDEGFSTFNLVIQSNPLVGDIVPSKFVFFYNDEVNLPLVTVDELYFNRAEAHIRKSGGMNDQAKADLRLLLDNQPYTAGGLQAKKASMDALANREQESIDFLLLQKRLRFYAEGMRWFDIRRHMLPVIHQTTGGTFAISGTDPAEYVIQLPAEEVANNPAVDEGVTKEMTGNLNNR